MYSNFNQCDTETEITFHIKIQVCAVGFCLFVVLFVCVFVVFCFYGGFSLFLFVLFVSCLLLFCFCLFGLFVCGFLVVVVVVVVVFCFVFLFFCCCWVFWFGFFLGGGGGVITSLE